ncbi:hypothetical protein HYFRA_00001221 [Hymenoscyphus fraxineus]|uniref:5-formyltetrahydrofolate cyclo-ligase n=1 Tax=Hymenoscyphus fraxineus TaxID=746836 RepID=A0A9N9PH09_9HELO|nr:hypothetical protein HYFRA_00001221 [Hymenoscyphus fraxineus]
MAQQQTETLNNLDTADMAASVALKAAKKELRTWMKGKLHQIPEDVLVAQSNAVFQTLNKFPSYQKAQRVGIYLSMPKGELQTDEIVRHALVSGKQVFVPFLHKPKIPIINTPVSVMDMVRLDSIADYEALKRDSWGIPTIDKLTVHEREHILGDETEKADLDMILVPGVAFDLSPEGLVRRLGHGLGFYDYFLHRYSTSHGNELSLGPRTSPLLYGLALKEQFLGVGVESGLSIPVGEHDRLLHGVLVGDGTFVDTVNKTA